MREAHWHERDNRVLGYLLRENDGNGSARRLLVLFNASPETQRFVLPPGDGGWRLLLDTLDAHPASERESAPADKPRRLAPRSIQIFTGPGEETAIHE
jgi:pullulanase/glycogen debranching enzyme